MTTTSWILLGVYFMGLGLFLLMVYRVASNTAEFQQNLRKGMWVRVDLDDDKFHGTICDVGEKTVEIFDGEQIVVVHKSNIYQA